MASAAHEKVDKLEVFWPSGKVETLTNVGADHFYILKEGEGILPARNGAAGKPGGQAASDGCPAKYLDKLLFRSAAADIL